MSKRAAILILLVVFLAGYLTAFILSVTDSDDGPEKSWTSNSAISAYAEALAHIKQRAVFSAPVGDLQDMVASSLNAYLARMDPYSDFLSPEEYARFRGANAQSNGGIGLDIEKRRNGDIICYPVENGPAVLSGIKSGERLLAVDGVPVTGKSLPAIVALVTGVAGEDVVLELSSLSGVHRLVTLTRSKQTVPALSEYRSGYTRIIKLSSFAPDTRQKLSYLISAWHKNTPIIIDLRGCGGGDFHAAVDSAMLFLKEGEPIISVKGRAGTQSYSSTLSHQPPVQRVFLWQDEFTASAAEIFIAALTENVRATSVGLTTGGKGTRQDVIELQNAGALILTTGYLITPHGRQFDGKGLPPMHRIDESGQDTQAFLNKIAALMD
jgi:carboxyl-terminal processing protease